MSRIDWPGLMRVGLNGLRLAPGTFWTLSPVELRIMLGAEPSASALTRTRLEELAAAYPDAKPAAKGEWHDGYRGPDGSDHGAGDDAGVNGGAGFGL